MNRRDVLAGAVAAAVAPTALLVEPAVVDPCLVAACVDWQREAQTMLMPPPFKQPSSELMQLIESMHQQYVDLYGDTAECF